MTDAEIETLHAALEPASLPMGNYEVGATLSIAISLKRIADALHGDDQNTGMKHALAEMANRAFNGWGPTS